MDKYLHIFLISTLFLVSTQSFAQEATKNIPSFDSGLGVNSGIGYTRIRDEYVSDERYSGITQFYGIGWSRIRKNYGFHANLDYQFTPQLNSGDLSAQVDQLEIGCDYLFHLSGLILLSRTLSIYLGPTCRLLDSQRSQALVMSSSYIPPLNSLITVFAGGIRVEGFLPLDKRMQAAVTAETSIISYTQRSVSADGGTSNRLLAIPDLMDAECGIGAIYKLAGPVALTAEYRFQLLRVTSWDFFMLGTDNLILSVKYVL